MSALEFLLADRVLRPRVMQAGASFYPAPGDAVPPVAGQKIQDGIADLTYDGTPGNYTLNLPTSFPNGIIAPMIQAVTFGGALKVVCCPVGPPFSNAGAVGVQVWDITSGGAGTTEGIAVAYVILGW